MKKLSIPSAMLLAAIALIGNLQAMSPAMERRRHKKQLRGNV
jgi:hypothetical protein